MATTSDPPEDPTLVEDLQQIHTELSKAPDSILSSIDAFLANSDVPEPIKETLQTWKAVLEDDEGKPITNFDEEWTGIGQALKGPAASAAAAPAAAAASSGEAASNAFPTSEEARKALYTEAIQMLKGIPQIEDLKEKLEELHREIERCCAEDEAAHGRPQVAAAAVPAPLGGLGFGGDWSPASRRSSVDSLLVSPPAAPVATPAAAWEPVQPPAAAAAAAAAGEPAQPPAVAPAAAGEPVQPPVAAPRPVGTGGSPGFPRTSFPAPAAAAAAGSAGAGAAGTEEITVNVTTYSGKKTPVSILPSATVGELKQKIFDITGTPIHDQRLIWNRQRILHDEETLFYNGIRGGDTILLTFYTSASRATETSSGFPLSREDQEKLVNAGAVPGVPAAARAAAAASRIDQSEEAAAGRPASATNESPALLDLKIRVDPGFNNADVTGIDPRITLEQLVAEVSKQHPYRVWEDYNYSVIHVTAEGTRISYDLDRTIDSTEIKNNDMLIFTKGEKKDSSSASIASAAAAPAAAAPAAAAPAAAPSASSAAATKLPIASTAAVQKFLAASRARQASAAPAPAAAPATVAPAEAPAPITEEVEEMKERIGEEATRPLTDYFDAIQDAKSFFIVWAAHEDPEFRNRLIADFINREIRFDDKEFAELRKDESLGKLFDDFKTAYTTSPEFQEQMRKLQEEVAAEKAAAAAETEKAKQEEAAVAAALAKEQAADEEAALADPQSFKNASVLDHNTLDRHQERMDRRMTDAGIETVPDKTKKAVLKNLKLTLFRLFKSSNDPSEEISNRRNIVLATRQGLVEAQSAYAPGFREIAAAFKAYLVDYLYTNYPDQIPKSGIAAFSSFKPGAIELVKKNPKAFERFKADFESEMRRAGFEQKYITDFLTLLRKLEDDAKGTASVAAGALAEEPPSGEAPVLGEAPAVVLGAGARAGADVVQRLSIGPISYQDNPIRKQLEARIPQITSSLPDAKGDLDAYEEELTAALQLPPEEQPVKSFRIATAFQADLNDEASLFSMVNPMIQKAAIDNNLRKINVETKTKRAFTTVFRKAKTTEEPLDTILGSVNQDILADNTTVNRIVRDVLEGSRSALEKFMTRTRARKAALAANTPITEDLTDAFTVENPIQVRIRDRDYTSAAPQPPSIKLTPLSEEQTFETVPFEMSNPMLADAAKGVKVRAKSFVPPEDVALTVDTIAKAAKSITPEKAAMITKLATEQLQEEIGEYFGLTVPQRLALQTAILRLKAADPSQPLPDPGLADAALLAKYEKIRNSLANRRRALASPPSVVAPAPTAPAEEAQEFTAVNPLRQAGAAGKVKPSISPSLLSALGRFRSGGIAAPGSEAAPAPTPAAAPAPTPTAAAPVEEPLPITTNPLLSGERPTGTEVGGVSEKGKATLLKYRGLATVKETPLQKASREAREAIDKGRRERGNAPLAWPTAAAAEEYPASVVESRAPEVVAATASIGEEEHPAPPAAEQAKTNPKTPSKLVRAMGAIRNTTRKILGRGRNKTPLTSATAVPSGEAPNGSVASTNNPMRGTRNAKIAEIRAANGATPAAPAEQMALPGSGGEANARLAGALGAVSPLQQARIGASGAIGRGRDRQPLSAAPRLTAPEVSARGRLGKAARGVAVAGVLGRTGGPAAAPSVEDFTMTTNPLLPGQAEAPKNARKQHGGRKTLKKRKIGKKKSRRNL